jgi:hypothetical protein
MIGAVIALEATIGAARTAAVEPIDIGSRLELLVDDYLVERLAGGAELRMHRPVPREVALVADAPWEGNACGYMTVFQDGDRYRMYYRGAHVVYTADGYTEPHREVYCYAESADGIHWTKPELGLFEFEGSKANNIVRDGIGTHAFVPFRDANPACAPEVAYKAVAVGGGEHGLYAFGSPDGIHWSLLSDKPVITQGAFDSQNLAFWDTLRGEYRCYLRDFREGRDIRTCTSQDFLHWTDPTFLEYSSSFAFAHAGEASEDVKDTPGAKYPPGRVSELYTNQVIPYYRAPHIFLGFPTRYIDRGWTESHTHLPELAYRRLRGAKSVREGTAVTDGMLMSSRDAQRFHVWPESFIRPGLRRRDSWFYGDNYQSWGLVETKSAIEDAPSELSAYVSEASHQPRGNQFRRYTLRIDGFASAQAPLSGGELLTKPLIFAGSRLVLNFSTSAAGTIQVELQEADGTPIPGFALADCHEVFGDELERTVAWHGGSDVSGLAGKPVRLRFVLRDADLYSLRFTE